MKPEDKFRVVLKMVEVRNYGRAMNMLTEIANKHEKLAFNARSIHEYMYNMNFGEAEFWLRRIINEQDT